MIEDELRAAFARQENLVPDPAPLNAAIDRAATTRRRRRLAARVTGAAGALIALVGLTAVALPQRPPPLAQDLLLPATPLGDRIAAGPLNLLLVGTDRKGPAGSADTLILVHVPATRDHAFLLSLPRDTGVVLPGTREPGYGGGWARLGEAYEIGSRSGGAAGGLALTSQAVTALTGVRVDAAGALDLPALSAATDAVGGVRFCPRAAVRSLHTGRVYPVGCRVYSGADAADLLRQRLGMPNGALDRDRNARDFLRALAVRVAATGALTDPVRLHRLIKAAGLGLVFSGGTGALPGLLVALRGVDPRALRSVSLPAEPTVVPGDTPLARPPATPDHPPLARPSATPDGAIGMRLTRPAAELLAAMRTDTADEFLNSHPELYDR